MIAAVVVLIITLAACLWQLAGGIGRRVILGAGQPKRTYIVRSSFMGADRWRRALRGWRELHPGAPYADLVFMDGTGYRNKKLYPTKAMLKSRVDSIAIYDKAKLHRVLTTAAPGVIARTFEVGPESLLPDGVWMIRSNMGHVGSHSQVAISTEELRKLYGEWADDKSVIMASEYVVNPMLYNGYKFHLRIYMIVAVLAEKKAWMIHDGLLIPALRPYVAGDWTNADIHDTHGKDNPAIRQFPSETPELAHLGPMCKDALSLAMAALLPLVDKWPESENAFELFGADIMFWDDGRPVIIEINGTPAIGENTQESLDAIFNGYLATVMTDVFGPMGDPTRVSRL